MLGFLSAKKLSNGFHFLVLGALIVGALIFIFLSSIFVYAVFWWYMIPRAAVTMPVDFMFNKSPSAEFNAFANIDLREFGDLTTNDYSLSMELNLPRSELNRQAGNFVTRFFLSNLDLSGIPPEEWAHATSKPHVWSRHTMRMSLLPYRSSMLELVDDLAFAPLYIFGLQSQSSSVKVNVADHISQPVKNTPFLAICISEHLDISRAQLVWRVQLQGVRWMISQFPLASFFIGTSFIMYVELVAVFVAVLVFRPTIPFRTTKPEPVNPNDILEERFKKYFKQKSPSPIPQDSRIKSFDERRRPSAHAIRRRNVPLRQIARTVEEVRRRQGQASSSSWDQLDQDIGDDGLTEDTFVNSRDDSHSAGTSRTELDLKDETN